MDDDQCTACPNTSTLTVHHQEYWDQFTEHLHLNELRTLCWPCHQKLHPEQTARQAAWKARKAMESFDPGL